MRAAAFGDRKNEIFALEAEPEQKCLTSHKMRETLQPWGWVAGRGGISLFLCKVPSYGWGANQQTCDKNILYLYL